jgi:putative heme iron utilization protein
MADSNEQVCAARQLLAGALHGVLSTHSQEHPGYPFGSVGPYVLDRSGLPVFLLSDLSQHTRNLAANPRCALTVMAESGPGDVQQRARLSAVGEVEACDARGVADRYFRYYPSSRMYFEELGFRFYRFRPLRFHWNGGFATARWFSPDRVVQANPLAAEEEQRIVEHMTIDHEDALRRYLQTAGYRVYTSPAVTMVGLDAEGMDLRQADRLFRVPLDRPIAGPAEAREVLVAMAS